MAKQINSADTGLSVIGVLPDHTFITPCKMINEGQDMSSFLVSKAYRDILTFLMQLNHSMFPLSLPSPNRGEEIVKTFEINNPRQRFSETVVQLQELLSALDSINDEVELDTGPRRFGNVSFRKWCNLLEERSTDLLRKHLSTDVARVKSDSAVGPSDELRAYLIGSFGSSQRLDYGTGHELSFLAFLGCLWKLGAFGSSPSENDMREIVIGVLHACVSYSTISLQYISQSLDT